MSALVICKQCKTEFGQSHFNRKLCSEACRIEARSAARARHKLTDAWRASNDRWVKSERRKRNEYRYRQSPTAKKKAVARSLRCLKNSANLQEKKRAHDIKFGNTAKGREINRLAKLKYRKTELGRAASKNAKARRRAFEKDGHVSAAEWRAALEKAGHRCSSCRSQAKLEMDHTIPLSKGGQHRADNIQALCRPCNAAKGNKIWPS